MTLHVPDDATGGRDDKSVWRGAKYAAKTQRKQICVVYLRLLVRRRGSLSSSYRSAQKIESRPDESANVRFLPFSVSLIQRLASFFAARQRLEAKKTTCRDRRHTAPRRALSALPMVMKRIARVYSITVVIKRRRMLQAHGRNSTAFSAASMVDLRRKSLGKYMQHSCTDECRGASGIANGVLPASSASIASR